MAGAEIALALPAIHGHAEVRAALARAVRSSTFPQSILLHGPEGVGKERLGLWIAMLLMCEQELEEPCGRCASCRLGERLEHPDVHWFFPLPRPDASSPGKLREKLEDARAVELQRRRANPFQEPEYDRAPAHFLASIRTVQRLASLRPTSGQRMVFVIGDAELMVPQESSPEAANAFLKLLEEPPAGMTFILTSSQPGALLPTIRSRVPSIRVTSVPEREIHDLLTEADLVPADQRARIARLSRGSVRRALRLVTSGAGGLDADRKAGRDLLLAALANDSTARLGAAHDRRPAGARNDLVSQLDALAEWLRDLLAVASGAPERVTDPDAVPMLARAVDQRGVAVQGVMEGLERVSRARELAQYNVNPQLIVADLLRKLQRDLLPATTTGGST
ncbi:MAG: hypothetical protein GEU90_03965 [Gemmatimonas sp.]|nr:hypothetical protein [Gemmatimonas sp.]